MKYVLLVVLICIISLLLVWAGYFMGRTFTQKPLPDSLAEIAVYNSKLSLGELVTDEDQRKGMAQAYLEPEKCLDEMNRYTWRIPTAPTPFVGHAPRPGDWGIAHVNGMQFRHANELETPKPAGTFRIFLTGGSTAFGSGASEDEKTIAGYLQAMLDSRPPVPGKDRFEVVNTAVSGWASTHERILIENRLLELEPDLVVSLSGNNDVHWGVRKRNVMWFRGYGDQHFWNLVQLAYLNSRYGSFDDVVILEDDLVPPEIVAKRLILNVRLGAYALGLINTPYVYLLQPNLKTTKKALSERENAYLEGHDKNKAYYLDCYDLLRKKLGEIDSPNFHFTDLSLRFDGMSQEDEIFLDSYHFGDRGNRIVAEAIFDAVAPVIGV